MNEVLEFLYYLNKSIGKNIKPKFLSVQEGDVFRTCADICKIKTNLNFETKINFEESLKLTVDYFKEYESHD